MKFVDRLKQSFSGTSTAVITLGGAVSGFRTVAQAIADFDLVIGDEVPMAVREGSSWEISLFRVDSLTQLSRVRVLASWSGGTAVTFPAGSHQIFCTVPASLLNAPAVSSPVDANDVGFDIALCAGQSNMTGRGAYDALIDAADARVWQWGCDSAQTAYYQKIFSGADPLHMREGIATGKTGPATSFARTYAATVPTNRRVLLIPLAKGATGLVGGDWAPGSPGATLYENAIAQANLAIAAAQAIYPKSRVVGTIWVQGENDAVGGITQEAYATALKALIAGFRSRITGAANSWFIIGGMVPERIAAYPTQYNPIVAAHQQVAAETDKCAYVPGPTGYAASGDTIHYTSPGSRILGARMALAVQSAKTWVGTPDNGGVPDTTAPTLTGQMTSSNVGTNGFTLTWPSATDNVAVAGYETSTDGGTTYSNAGNVLARTITGLAPATAYQCRVRAFDAAGLRSTPLSLTVNTGAASDSSAPTMNGSLTTSSVSSSGYTMDWPAASDNIAVTGYETSTDGGTTWSDVGNVLTRTVTGAAPSTLYNLRVRAYDAAGNRAATPLSATVTTLTPAGDTTLPTMNGTLTTTNVTRSGYTMNWPAASDNVAVTGYETSTNGGSTWSDAGNVLSRAISGTTAGAQYNIAVRAYDAAGNRAATPLTATVTTPAAAANTYDFEDDTIGAAPAGITVTGGTMEVVNASVVSGWTGKALHFKDPKPAAGSIHACSLDNIPVAADRTVIWKRGAAPVGGARDAMMIRTSAGAVTGYTGARFGYLFQTSGSTNNVRLYKLVASGATSIGSAVTLNDSASRWFRASVIGTTLKLDYSDDDKATWVNLITATDTTYSSGGVDYVSGFNGEPTQAYIDEITWS